MLFIGGTTRSFIDEYCNNEHKGGLLEDKDIATSCIGIVYLYTKTSTIRNSLYAKYIALLRNSDANQLVESNLEVLNDRLVDSYVLFFSHSDSYRNTGRLFTLTQTSR